MKRLFAAALAMGLVFASPVLSFDLTDMTDAERAAFRAEIRAYLLDNPDVIMEAVAILEQRDAQQKAADDVALITANSDAIFKDTNSWVGGNPEGDVTLVEFTDYRCGYCRKAHDEVAKLVSEDGNIRFVIKEFPILGEASMTSAKFAIATRLIGGDAPYEAAHEALIKLKGQPEVPVLRRLAKTLELDADAVFAKMESDEVSAIIAANHALARELQINGTPTFVLGDDKLLRGYLPLASMQALVAQTRAR